MVCFLHVFRILSIESSVDEESSNPYEGIPDFLVIGLKDCFEILYLWLNFLKLEGYAISLDEESDEISSLDKSELEVWKEYLLEIGNLGAL